MFKGGHKLPVRISTTNSKLGLIPSVNLVPVVTCRENCPCVKECYAMRGNFRFANVRKSMEQNYEYYKSNPEKYFEEIKLAINNGMVSYAYFRWHAAGDIVDKQYFEYMVKVAEQLPLTSFLAFTKKFEIVNEYIKDHGALPQNLNIVFSAWGADFKIDNPYRLPVAYVRFKDDEKTGTIPTDAVECSGDCTTCLQCWKIKAGQSVVFKKH